MSNRKDAEWIREDAFLFDGGVMRVSGHRRGGSVRSERRARINDVVVGCIVWMRLKGIGDGHVWSAYSRGSSSSRRER